MLEEKKIKNISLFSCMVTMFPCCIGLEAMEVHWRGGEHREGWHQDNGEEMIGL
jgi:hypothetical protein